MVLILYLAINRIFIATVIKDSALLIFSEITLFLLTLFYFGLLLKRVFKPVLNIINLLCNQVVYTENQIKTIANKVTLSLSSSQKSNLQRKKNMFLGILKNCDNLKLYREILVYYGNRYQSHSHSSFYNIVLK